MKNLRFVFFCIIILLVGTNRNNAQTEEPAAEEEKTFWQSFSGNLTGAYNESRGNVEKWRFFYGAKLKFERKNHELSISGEGNKEEKLFVETSSETGETHKNWKLIDEGYKANLYHSYKFSQRQAIYEKLSYFRNQFKGYEQQYKLGAGYLLSIYKGKHGEFGMRCGYQYRKSELTDNTNNEEHVAQAGFRGKLNLTSHVSLKTEFNYLGDIEDIENHYYMDDTFLGIEITITKYLSLEARYSIEYSNIPPVEGKEKLDSYTDFAITFKF